MHIIVTIKRKYESERWQFNEMSRGDNFRKQRNKKAKYGQRKHRVSICGRGKLFTLLLKFLGKL